MNIVFGAIGVGIAMLTAGPAFAACQRGPATYDMPAQRLDQALQQSAHVSGCAVEVDPALIADRPAAVLRGRYTPEQALARLVRNTGYTAHATARGVAIDDSVLSITMSEARGLRTLLQNGAKAGTIAPARATRLRGTLNEVVRSLPRLVNAQGMLTPAQKADAVRKLETVRAAVGSRYDARDWAAFKARSY